MDRRAFLAGAVAALAPSVVVEAQQPAKTPRIGIIRTASSAAEDRSTDSLRQGLRDLGYVEGQTVALEIRYSEQGERLHVLAKELVDLRVDVIVAAGASATHAIRQASTTIPIVLMSADPVGAGLAGSLARPERNITGLSTMAPETEASGWGS